MHLCVSSKDRDPDRYPTPSKYTIRLDPPIKRVKSIALIHAGFCNTQYSLPKPYPIHIPEFGIDTEIPAGMHTMMSLERTLDALLQKVHVDRTTMSLVISSDQPFTLNGTPSTFKDPWHQATIPNPLETAPMILELETLGKVTECDCQGGHHSFSTASILPLQVDSKKYIVDETPHIINVQNPDVILDSLRITIKSALPMPIPDHEFIFALSVM